MKVTRYMVFTHRPGAPVAPPPSYADAEIRWLTREDLPALEASRPGYAPRAARYLDHGHQGAGVWVGDQLAALSWARHNDGGRRVWVDAYPVEPGRVYFHSAWTSPAFRKRGYHAALRLQKLVDVRARLGDVLVEGMIAPDGDASARSLLNAGFEPSGTLWVLGIRGRTLSWRTA